MRTLTTRLVAAAATATMAFGAVAADGDAPAGFTHEENGLFFAEQAAWFVGGASPVSNLDQGAGQNVTWSTDGPGSATTHTVMNNYSTFAGDRYANTFTAEGTLVGHLDTLAVEFIAHTPSGICTLDALSFDLRIDDETILFQEQSSPSAGLRTVDNGDGNFTIMFVFTGIHDVMDRRGLVGDETTEHTVFMNFANFYACQEAIAYFGSADHPARIIANVQPQGRRGRWSNYTEVDVMNPPPPLS